MDFITPASTHPRWLNVTLTFNMENLIWSSEVSSRLLKPFMRYHDNNLSGKTNGMTALKHTAFTNSVEWQRHRKLTLLFAVLDLSKLSIHLTPTGRRVCHAPKSEDRSKFWLDGMKPHQTKNTRRKIGQI